MTIRIIAMTAIAFSGVIQQSLAAGMNAHVSKPVESKLLEKTIRSIKSGGGFVWGGVASKCRSLNSDKWKVKSGDCSLMDPVAGGRGKGRGGGTDRPRTGGTAIKPRASKGDFNSLKKLLGFPGGFPLPRLRPVYPHFMGPAPV